MAYMTPEAWLCGRDFPPTSTLGAFSLWFFSSGRFLGASWAAQETPQEGSQILPESGKNYRGGEKDRVKMSQSRVPLLETLTSPRSLTPFPPPLSSTKIIRGKNKKAGKGPISSAFSGSCLCEGAERELSCLIPLQKNNPQDPGSKAQAPALAVACIDISCPFSSSFSSVISMNHIQSRSGNSTS